MQLPLARMIAYGLCFTAFGIYGIIAYRRNLKLGEDKEEKKKKIFKKGGVLFLITSIMLLILGILPLLAGFAQLLK